jgi:hypothetical protein
MLHAAGNIQPIWDVAVRVRVKITPTLLDDLLCHRPDALRW